MSVGVKEREQMEFLLMPFLFSPPRQMSFFLLLPVRSANSGKRSNVSLVLFSILLKLSGLAAPHILSKMKAGFPGGAEY